MKPRSGSTQALAGGPETWLLAALEFAAHKHRNQRRKDAQASPYINHPIALAHMLVAEGGVKDTKTLVAAILHDTVEDTDTTSEELRARFGKLVADVVREVTDDKALPKRLFQNLPGPQSSVDRNTKRWRVKCDERAARSIGGGATAWTCRMGSGRSLSPCCHHGMRWVGRGR